MVNILNRLVCVFCIVISVNFMETGAQGMNLLQKYMKEYFQEYSPNTVRSYTLYGNGQNGVADFQAGLPYPLEQTGKVKNLVFSPMKNPLPNPGQKTASQKAYSGSAPSSKGQPNQWDNPISANAFNPWTVDPNQLTVPVPDPVVKYLSSRSSDVQVENTVQNTKSRTMMVNSGELGPRSETVVKGGNDQFGEISIESSFAFQQ